MTVGPLSEAGDGSVYVDGVRLLPSAHGWVFGAGADECFARPLPDGGWLAASADDLGVEVRGATRDEVVSRCLVEVERRAASDGLERGEGVAAQLASPAGWALPEPAVVAHTGDGRPVRGQPRRRRTGRDGCAARVALDRWQECAAFASWAVGGPRVAGGCGHKTCPVCVGRVRRRAVRRLSGVAAVAGVSAWYFVTVTPPAPLVSKEQVKAFISATRRYLREQSMGGTAFIEAPVSLMAGASEESCVCDDGCYRCHGSRRLPVVHLHVHAVVLGAPRWTGGGPEYPTLRRFIDTRFQGRAPVWAADCGPLDAPGTWAVAQGYAGIGRVNWSLMRDAEGAAAKYAAKAVALYASKGDARGVDETPWRAHPVPNVAGPVRAAGVAAAWQGRARWSWSWGCFEALGVVRDNGYLAPDVGDDGGRIAPAVRWFGARPGPRRVLDRVAVVALGEGVCGEPLRDAGDLHAHVLGHVGLVRADGTWCPLPGPWVPVGQRARWLAAAPVRAGLQEHDGTWLGRPLRDMWGRTLYHNLADYWPDFSHVWALAFG